MILEKYLEFIYGLNSDISKMIEKEEINKLKEVYYNNLFLF